MYVCVVIVQNICCFASLIKHNISFFSVAARFVSSSVYRIVCLRVRVNNRIKKDREKKEIMLYTAYLLGNGIDCDSNEITKHLRNCLIFSVCVCLSVIECVVFVWCAIVNCFVMELFVIHMITFFSTNVSIEFRHFFGAKNGKLLSFFFFCLLITFILFFFFSVFRFNMLCDCCHRSRRRRDRA